MSTRPNSISLSALQKLKNPLNSPESVVVAKSELQRIKVGVYYKFLPWANCILLNLLILFDFIIKYIILIFRIYSKQDIYLCCVNNSESSNLSNAGLCQIELSLYFHNVSLTIVELSIIFFLLFLHCLVSHECRTHNHILFTILTLSGLSRVSNSR